MRERAALTIGWLATLWLAEVLVISMVEYTRGLDVAALALALPVQLFVVILWSLVPRLPLWLVAGHALILLGLGIGLVVAGPAGPMPAMPFGLPVPWLIVGLIPTGVAMIVAAAVHWRPADTLVR
ncbi:hypothetical protein BH24CHL7_BH24CHL7_05800 [soil metagenome]